MNEAANKTPDRAGAKRVVAFPKFAKPTVRVTLWEERRRPNEAISATGWRPTVTGW